MPRDPTPEIDRAIDLNSPINEFPYARTETIGQITTALFSGNERNY